MVDRDVAASVGEAGPRATCWKHVDAFYSCISVHVVPVLMILPASREIKDDRERL